MKNKQIFRSKRFELFFSTLLLAGLTILFQNCTSSTSQTGNGGQSTTPGVVLKGSRMLGIDVNSVAQDTTFNQTFTEAQNMGSVAVDMLIDWNSVETTAGSGITPGTYVDPGGELATANAFYPLNNTLISFNLSPIDMGKYVVPSDLAGKTLNDLTLINRYLQMLDFVLSKLPSVNFVMIQVGNEIDSSSQANTATFWSNYYTFLNYVVPHIHTARPGVKVGLTATFNGAVGRGSGTATTKGGFQQVAGVMDEVGITYYPLNSDYTVEDISVIATDFNTLASLYTTPIYIEEAGSRATGLI